MAQAINLPIRFPIRPTTPPTILSAHAHMVERIEANKPCYLNPAHLADADDINERAEHIRFLMMAVTDYVRVAVKDIDDSSNHIDAKYIYGCLDDLTSEIVGALRNAADDIDAAA